MLSAIHVIERIGISTDSALRAFFKAKDMQLSPTKALEFIQEITGNDEVRLSGEQATYTFYYVIQNAVRAKMNQSVVEGDDLLYPAIDQANKLLERLTTGDLQFVRATLDEVPKVDSVGNPKKKKGAKQELAASLYVKYQDKPRKEIIQLFIDEIGMSKAGATTYFYNMKKRFSPTN
jgi:hypothetical protein